MKLKNTLFILIAILLLNCKKNETEVKTIVAKQKTNTISKTLNKNNFIKTEWIEIEKVNNSFKNSKVKEEWLSFVKINDHNKATIFLMESSEYTLDSIQATEKNIKLHIKGADWIYRFYWVNKNKHIGRWDYVYNTKIDSSLSMYVVDKKYKHLLN